jgi:hypothetical protein
MSQTTPILVIGHVTRDIIGGEERLGGAAAYVARALSARGMDVALVTRSPDDPLLKPLATDPRIRLHLLPSESFTTFRHYHTQGERRLVLETCAADITVADIPSPWRDQPFVFLVPVMGECGTGLLTAFPESELIVGAQGWLRTVEAAGRVRPCAPPETLLATRLLAVTLSEDDHTEAEALACRMARQCRVVALTRGDKAVTIFEKSGENGIPIEPVKQVHDTIGAGDIFTALLGMRIMGGDTVRIAVTRAAQGATHYVAKGMAGLDKLQQVDIFHPPNHRAKSRIRALIARSEVVEDPGHAENTLEWLLRMEATADEALQIAALGHDIDRATPDRVKREAYPDYDAFKAAHARRGARLLRGILEDCGLESTIIKEACRLVVHHETGGDSRSDLLKDVDSISFFDVNLPLYYQRESPDETRRRCVWGYQRLSGRMKKVAEGMTYEDEKLTLLLNEAIREACRKD